MKILSGTYQNPDGEPVAGVLIRFQLLETTADSFSKLASSTVTTSEGHYQISLSDGRYKVTVKKGTESEQVLGVILVSEETEDGTLNDYLLAGMTSHTDAMLLAIQKAYQQMLSLLGNPAVTAQTYADIPASPSGWFLISADETKGGNPSVYLFKDDARYWFAMVRDA